MCLPGAMAAMGPRPPLRGWARYAKFESTSEIIQHEGYASCEDHPRGAEYEWVYIDCFTRFCDAMGWTDVTA
jgi:hypothetical protein